LRYFFGESNAERIGFPNSSRKWSFENAALAQTDTLGAVSVGAESAQRISDFFACACEIVDWTNRMILARSQSLL
jgi:hypothetical protein